jgi:catechol 2,3-dioxygenase-like lactoylglutathione lyase family enzyme
MTTRLRELNNFFSAQIKIITESLIYRMERTKTITRHLTGSVATGAQAPLATYEDVVSFSVQELQKRFGGKRSDACEIVGVNHVAFVSSDMARTLWFWCEVLGMRLVKTLEIDQGGQHFFIEGGPGCAIAYFYFKDAPKKAPGISSIDWEKVLAGKGFSTAHGSVNHVAFNVPLSKLRDYRKRVQAANVGMVSPILFHSDVDPSGYSKSRDENTTWESFYFEGPDSEYLEFTAQTARPFSPEYDIRHKPAVAE